MDSIVEGLRRAIPDEVLTQIQAWLERLEIGQYEQILSSPEARKLLFDEANIDGSKWSDGLFERLGALLSDRSKPGIQTIYFCIGYAALLAFVQSNVTGPPLPFSSAKLLVPVDVSSDRRRTQVFRQALLAGLGVDGIAAYKLTPNVELLCLAEVVFTNPAILKNVPGARLAKLRTAFMHQRLLSEPSSTLQTVIYEDLKLLADDVTSATSKDKLDSTLHSDFLLERATIHIHHGYDKLALADVQQAAEVRGFQFALTGLLGKRTKFQEKETSQLVVLAMSAVSSTSAEPSNGTRKSTADDEHVNGNGTTDIKQPENLDLNDDTLLESISFAAELRGVPEIQALSSLPALLASLDPASQPQLDPLDSSILLALASSITNTSPNNGLTREETLPYATRVLEGGSSNWQVYTQALLVRSRIEGYKSRTVERGLLQLQALVDQVIADTADVTGKEGEQTANRDDTVAASTFLPKPKQSESAPVTERLRYIFQLASPTRWDLEAELAARWVSMGGLRSALEIYERLEMWAEAALCWAATEREDRARKIVRRQLYLPTSGEADVPGAEVDDEETWEGSARDPAPLDAPRLYCILGDIDQSTEMFEKAWEVSGQRYARAQRSLGRHYYSLRDYPKAADAYTKSLKVNQLNQQSWFALGCAQLELEAYPKAVESFSRCVQLDDTDAEAWSNLAAALLRIDPDGSPTIPQPVALDDDTEHPISTPSMASHIQKTHLDALSALKRAAKLKHDSPRIWDNVLTVAASLDPPDYTSMLSALQRIVALRGPSEGEKAIDLPILRALVNNAIASSMTYDPTAPGVVRMTVRFVDEAVIPLITASAQLWRLVARLALWRRRPGSALEAEEKAWRAVTVQPGWETESEARWDEVVEATVRLCEAYESLGPMERTEGMGVGEVVARDWKFKARSAVKGVMRRGKDSWEETEGWGRLEGVTEGLKS
nr:hypothetical protein B0A51_12281 [Rachicladosporium sp. CCFEE 5018]